MAFRHYLAMTSAEVAACEALPQELAWMACHFSPYSTGLSNIPSSLPPGSLLILNDRTPIHGHDKGLILSQLTETAQKLKSTGILLDFQIPDSAEAAALVSLLTTQLPCPVAVTKQYYAGTGSVFLPPVPCDVPLCDYLAPWKGHSVWLETALNSMTITVTENGASLSSDDADITALPFADDVLHCHYRTEVRDDRAIFTLHRSHADLETLLEEAASFGIDTAVGLYQEIQATKNRSG